VYDVAGRVVRRLFGDRTLEAGRHTLGWDGRDDAGRPVAAGVYYLRLTAPGGDATRKVVVVR
jgi:flagellar hook assembly protein FlgD